MDLDQIPSQLEKFIVCAGESRPGILALGGFAAVVVMVWLAAAIVRRVIRFAVAVAEAVMAAVAGLSVVAVAGLVAAVFALTG